MWSVFFVGYLLAFVAITFIGLATWRLVFGHLEPEAYLIAKITGLVPLIGLFWLIGYSGLLPLTQPVVFTVLLLLTAGAVWYLRRHQTINWRRLLYAEAIFAGLMLVFIVVRGFYPTVTDGEKPMDIMMLSSSLRAIHLPPEDSWLAGQSLNYYYFGYFAFANVAKTIGASSFLAFNFGLAAIWSLSLTGLSYLGWAFTKNRWAMLTVPLVYGFFGNLDSLNQIIHHGGGIFDWWRGSRAIPRTITEYPAFSYLFADFHPHMIVASWLILLIASLKNIYGTRASWLQGLFIGCLAGQIFTVSSWTIFSAGLLIIATLFGSPLAWPAVGAGLLGLVVMAGPYQLGLSSIWQGVAPVGERSAFGAWLTHWGLLLIGTVAFFFSRYRTRFTISLVAVAAILLILPEILMVKDVYGYRFNTVFKLFWDAWLLVAIIAGIGLIGLWQAGILGKIGAGGLVAVGLLYLIMALPGRYNHFEHWYGGDPAQLTFSEHPELRQSYEQLIKDPAGQVYESPGRSYSADSLLSAFTGLPTLLGWAGHETLWRGNAQEVTRREEMAKQITNCQIPLAIQNQFHFRYCLNERKELINVATN